MKREIKFRIVYKNTKTNQTRIIPISLGKSVPYLGGDWVILSEDQYIELKDKNGKEIYEGDICRFWGGLGIVFYRNELANYSLRHSDGDYYELSSFNPVEVIGNIYETKKYYEMRSM